MITTNKNCDKTNKDGSSDHYRISSLYFETTGARPYQAGYIFPFRYPAEYAVGWRIRTVIINPFSTINNHYAFVLLTGLVSGQASSFWNGQPMSIGAIIPRNRSSDPVFIKQADTKWHRIQAQDINNIWFELRDEQLNTVNTNFLVEIEILQL
jgi:hypothetical protein